eukprot:12024237-Alexandrium_andersonii.AAC.1
MHTLSAKTVNASMDVQRQHNVYFNANATQPEGFVDSQGSSSPRQFVALPLNLAWPHGMV